MKPKSLLAPERVAPLALVFVALATFATACGSKSTSSSTPTPNCAALSVCCSAPGFPSSEAASCTSATKANADASCQSTLGALKSLGLCQTSTSSSGSASSGGGVGGAGGGGGSTSSSSSGGGAGNGGSSATTSTASSSSSAAGGPLIQSLTANPAPVTPAGPTTISAVVSDSSGVAMLTGGTLTDKVYGTAYGAFGTPGGQGTFDYPVTWTQLNQAHPISFPAGGSETRVVTAEFFDMQSRTASQDLSLTLACSPASDASCSGTCKDLSTDVDNCGACGTTCSASKVCEGKDSFGCTCSGGHCAATEIAASLGGASCNAVCAKVGATCVANTCSGLPTGAAEEVEGQPNVAIACSAGNPYLCCCE